MEVMLDWLGSLAFRGYILGPGFDAFEGHLQGGRGFFPFGFFFFLFSSVRQGGAGARSRWAFPPLFPGYERIGVWGSSTSGRSTIGIFLFLFHSSQASMEEGLFLGSKKLSRVVME